MSGPQRQPEEPASRLGAALAALARWCMARPGVVAMLVLLPTLLCGVLAVRAPLDLSFAGLMDREHPEMQRYFEASRKFGLGGRLPLLVEGPEARLDTFVEQLDAQLSVDPAVARVRTRLVPERLDASPAWFVDASRFALWTGWVEAPEDDAALARLREALDGDGAQDPLRRPGARLVLVTLAQDSFERDLDAQEFPRIDALTQALAHQAGVRARYAGMPAIVEQDQRATLQRLGVMTPLSLLLALALLGALERRVLGLLAVGVPMIAAGIITLGILGLTLGRLTLMESLFGVLIFGLGVDFALHLGFRARELRAQGVGFEDAVAGSYAHTGPGVVIGALTTAGSFGVLALAPEPSFAHLGASGALGVSVCLLMILLVLPASWAGLGRRVPGETGEAPVQMGRLADLMAWVGTSAARRPVLHLLGAGMLFGLGAAGLPQLRYESELGKVVNRRLEAIPAAQAMHDTFGIDPIPWVLEVASLSEARRLEPAIVALPQFGQVESVARLFPRDLHARADWLVANRARIEQLSRAQPEARELLGPLLQAADETPPGPEVLPESLRAEFVASDGALTLFVFSAQAHMNAETARAEREALRPLAPEATSMAVLFELLLAAERPWMRDLLGYTLAFIALLLLVDLRRPSRVVFALVPVVAGCAFAFGLLGWLGVALNTVTLMAAPLVLGLGVDDGIHVVHRLRQAAPGEEGVAAASVSTPIALTTLTTCTSFGTLWLSGHPGLESMAWVMFLALPACWFASASTLPALASVLGRFRGD